MCYCQNLFLKFIFKIIFLIRNDSFNIGKEKVKTEKEKIMEHYKSK
jgi:hypothetical protein